METDLERLVRESIDSVLDKLSSELGHGESLAAASALAAGADTIFAEAVAARNIPHQVLLPQTPDIFFNAKDFFDSEAILKRAHDRLNGSNVIDVRLASASSDRRDRFSECGYEIALDSEILLAVVRDDESGGPGGTRETLRYAHSLGLRVFEISLGGNCPITETGGMPIQLGVTEQEVFKWPLPSVEQDGEDSVSPIVALKTEASRRSGREQRHFFSAAATVLLTHVAATAVAGWVLAQLWIADYVSPLKALLLAVGFGYFVYLHFYHPQHGWVTGRLVAELARSVVAMRGLRGRLGYLSDIHLLGCKHLIRSLNILHLREAHARPIEPCPFVATYIEKRVNVQLAFYEKQVDFARKRRLFLRIVFYPSSLLALILATAYSILHLRGWSPTEKVPILIFEFLPLALPMLAAGASSWAALLDLDRRVDHFELMIHFLTLQRERLRHATSEGILQRIVHRTERAMLQEVSEWHAKHMHVSGH